jgi:DNA invertase Pin-like site-specific DNA recombinase
MRVSQMGDREEGSENFHSTKFQDEDVYRHAEKIGAEIAVVRQELNLSGANWEKRQGFQECVALVESGEVDGVIVSYLSRFARDMRVAYMALGRIADAGGAVFTVSEGIDTRTRQGRMNFNIRMAMAQDEWEQRRDEIMRVHRTKISQGKPMRAPFGYMKDPDTGKLVRDPVQAPWVVRIFEWAAEGKGFREIARLLNSDPAAPPPTKKTSHWTPTTVRDLVKRRTYLGEVWHDRTRSVVKKGAHKELVSELLYARANMPKGERRDPRGKHTLAGLLRCANCRHMLKAIPTRGRVMYGCRRHSAAGPCPEPVLVNEANIIPLLHREAIRLWNVEGKEFGTVNRNPLVERARDELTILKERYKSWMHDDETRTFDREAWEEERNARKAAVDAAKEQLQTAMQAGLGAANSTEPAAMPTDPAELREMLLAAFETVFLRPRAKVASDMLVIPKGATVPEVPRRGKVFNPTPVVFPQDRPSGARVTG